MGRRSRSGEEKAARGNPGRRPIYETVGFGESPCNPPTGLDPAARAEWRRIAASLQRAKRLSKEMRGILVAYVSAWSEYRRADAACQRLEAEGKKREREIQRLHELKRQGGIKPVEFTAQMKTVCEMSEGLYYTMTGGGRREQPELRTRRFSRLDLVRFASQLGITPVTQHVVRGGIIRTGEPPADEAAGGAEVVDVPLFGRTK